MTRNLKVLGLALLAVFAMTAVAASSASASKDYWFTSDGSWTTLHGEQPAAFSDQFKTDGSAALGEGVVTCEKTTYTGSISGTTTTTIELTPVYEGCKLSPFGTATIHMNGCKYVIHTDEKGNTTNGSFDTVTTIECTENKDITITAVVAGVTKCVVHVEAQNLGTGIVLTNEEKEGVKDIKAHIEFKNIKYTQTTGEGSGHCDATSTTNNGVYKGAATIKGSNTAKEPTSIDVG